MLKSIRKMLNNTTIACMAIVVFIFIYVIMGTVDYRHIDYMVHVNSREELEKTTKPIRAKGIILSNINGLGNQLFIYAAALHFKRHFNIPVFLLHDSSTKTHTKHNYARLFKDVESIEANDPRVMTAKQFKFSRRSLNAYTNDNELPVDENVYIRLGETYFHNYEKIRDVIPMVKENVLAVLQPTYSNEITNNPKTCAFIHIRRGDYKYHLFGRSMLPFSYYQFGMDQLNMVGEVETIYIISNDIAWCRQQVWNTEKELIFYDDPDELKTLYLMSRCWAGAVISKSTFSLWGVFLGAHGKTNNIVYAKGVHFLDDLPIMWITQ